MADKKISDLTAATTLASGDLFEIENVGGNSRKVARSVLLTGGYEAGPPTPPLVGDFTWDNQGTSTATDGTGALVFKPQADAVLHGMVKAAPATPWDVYCRLEWSQLSTASNTSAVSGVAGILLKDTGGDNERLVFASYQERITGDENVLYAALIQRYTGASPPVFSLTPVVKYGHIPWKWLRVNNDGTTLTLYVSTDGRNWVSVGTETLAAFIDGAASIGFGAQVAANATEAPVWISYFSTTAPT